MVEKPIATTPSELSEIVKKAVSAAFRDVGIHAHDDDAVDQRRRDFQFLHDLRQSSESAKSKFGVFLLLTGAGGLVTIVLLGLRAWFSQIK